MLKYQEIELSLKYFNCCHSTQMSFLIGCGYLNQVTSESLLVTSR